MVFGQVRVPFYNGPFRLIFGLPLLNSVTNLDNRILTPAASRFYGSYHMFYQSYLLKEERQGNYKRQSKVYKILCDAIVFFYERIMTQHFNVGNIFVCIIINRTADVYIF